jgi:hypothetical protein
MNERSGEAFSPNKGFLTMQTKFFLAVGYGTLVFDAYLVLASIATKMMKAEYSGYLMPFGAGGAAEPSRFMVLLVATWTAVLAMGCLGANYSQSERTRAAGTLWFVAVLAIVWLVYLTPVVIDVSWSLFVQGW